MKIRIHRTALVVTAVSTLVGVPIATGLANQGERISANVDDQNYASSIRSNKMTDRRTEHASADCTPNSTAMHWGATIEENGKASLNRTTIKRA